MLSKAHHRWIDSILARAAGAAAVAALVAICALGGPATASAADPLSQTVGAVTQTAASLPAAPADVAAAVDPGTTPTAAQSAPTPPTHTGQTPTLVTPKAQVPGAVARALPLPVSSPAVHQSARDADAASHQPAMTVAGTVASAEPVRRSLSEARLGTSARVTSARRTVQRASAGAASMLSRTVQAADERVDSKLAPIVSGVLQSALLHDAIASIARITDVADIASGEANSSSSALMASSTERNLLSATQDARPSFPPLATATPLNRPAARASAHAGDGAQQGLAAGQHPLRSSAAPAMQGRGAAHAPVGAQSPEQGPAGLGAFANAAPSGFGVPIFLSLLGLLLLGLPRTMRRLGLASEPLRAAPFVLIPDRPG
jgi:hypothetical protein